MTTILDEVLGQIPDSKRLISDSGFEGANIILYTKDKEFFLDNKGIIKKVVDSIKKRVELRPDPSICMDMEKAEKAIKKLIPEEANVNSVIFDVQRSIVIIEAEKPGLAIGKEGELLKEIRKSVLWVPLIRRTPAIQSKLIENIRAVLYLNNDYRKKFLDKVGHRIYDGWIRGKKEEWIRVTYLGGAREVGRSCILLQTPESRILLDCGINVGGMNGNMFPYLDAPEFKIDELDAVICSHAHLDHSALIPWLYKMGYRGPCYMTAPTRDTAALLALDYIGVAFKQAKKSLYDSSDIKEMVKHTICLDYEEVSDITPDVRLTLYNSGHSLGSSMVHLHIGNGLHNLLYSLDWKTPVSLIDGKDNVFFNPIGEVIDKNFSKFPDLVVKNGIYEELVNLEGLKTIVFNPETYKTEIKAITSFIRHPITEELYELKTASGRKVSVTKSHSVFSVKDGNLTAVKVADLNEGDFIIGPKRIPLLNREPKINLLEHSPKLRIKIDNESLLMSILNKYKTRLDELEENDKNEALNWITEHYRFAKYKKEIAKKYKVHVRRIRRVFNQLGIKDHPRVKHSLPTELNVNKDFARFLGYYVAEGSIIKNSQTINVSNTNYKILDDCYKIIKDNFGIIGDVRYKDGVVLFHSKQLKYLVSEVLKCGKSAYTKRVPSQILLSSQEIISNFLYGYFSGDGGIISRDYGRCISASSKNPDLIQDVAFLLLQFGIVPTLVYNRYTKMYIASIYNSSKIKEFLEKIGIENKHLVSLIPNLVRKKNKGSFDTRIPLLSLSKKGQLMLSKTSWQTAKSCNILHLRNMDLPELDKKLVNSDLMFDQIKEIRKVKPTSKYVYDFKVKDCENFLGGEGFLFLHNTGDMKYLRTQLLEPASINFPRLETLMIESTYGGKENVLKSRKDSEEQLIKIVKDTIANKGKVLIPVLGVGRSQEVLLILEKAIREGKLEKIPVFVQGMVWDVTAIHTAYPDFLNRNVRKAIFHKDNNPFLSDIFKRVASSKEQKEVLEETGSCVILATAGMLNAGASVEYFKELAGYSKNSIIFVCYQAEGTLGCRVQNGEKHIQINNGGKPEIVEIKMNVHSIPALSGHADRNELIRFCYGLNPKPKKIIVNHGESSRCLDLASSLHKLNRVETNAPKNLESIRIR